MKAKLVKTVTDNYILVDPTKEFYGEGYVLGTTVVSDAPRLSLKNCEAIERGYDLDELFNKVDESIDFSEFDFTSFRLGFQKALEILGDKKFSEEDVISMIEKSRETGLTAEYLILNNQQTEWDVEVEMWFHGTRHKKGEWIPKLDADGCLILKRVV